MRILVVLLIIVVLMALGGWLVFRFGDDTASVQVQTDKIKQDTTQAVEKTKEVISRAGDEIDRAFENTAEPRTGGGK